MSRAFEGRENKAKQSQFSDDSLSGQATAKRFAQTSVASAKTEGRKTEDRRQNTDDRGPK